MLINAQLSLASGAALLFKADTDDDGKARKPILVTDPDEIAAYLCNDYNELETTYLHGDIRELVWIMFRESERLR